MTNTETKLADALRSAREYVAELLTEREAMFAGYGSMDEIRTVRETLAEVDEALAAHDTARAQPASVADGETFEVRKGKDGQFGIYMSDLNVRVATFTACTAATRDRISALLAAAPQPRAKGDAE